MAEQQAQSEWWKIACFTVPAIILLGSLSGWLSNSGYGNAWFDSLIKPAFMRRAGSSEWSGRFSMLCWASRWL